MDLQSVKQRFGIIGTNDQLNRALEIAVRVASTDLSVLITGESGVGKEFFPQVIHNSSSRKHGNYIAVNCGAIPEGTIDSELFGHEKGSFTGANEARKGYFEMANGGTIFLDEVAELPLTTQVRLLRVLQTGEFIKVGSSKVLKTDVRVVAATNINLPKAIERGKFREDLFYRLNTVPITVPALRERKEDIIFLFRRFISDISTQYRIPPISLTAEARKALDSYYWPGNVRQLKNVAEQISVIEQEREIDVDTLLKYLPDSGFSQALITTSSPYDNTSGATDRSYEILIPLMLDMKKEIAELKSMVASLGGVTGRSTGQRDGDVAALLAAQYPNNALPMTSYAPSQGDDIYDDAEEVTTEEVTKESVQREAILKALRKHNFRRKEAAKELFISERTLYRRIKELDIKEEY